MQHDLYDPACARLTGEASTGSMVDRSANRVLPPTGATSQEAIEPVWQRSIPITPTERRKAHNERDTHNPIRNPTSADYVPIRTLPRSPTTALSAVSPVGLPPPSLP